MCMRPIKFIYCTCSSAEERQQSFMSMLTTPTSNRATPRKSVSEFVSSVPVRVTVVYLFNFEVIF